MIEYLNNPALLVLLCEVLAFMTIVNIVLLVTLTRRNSKTVHSLNALVSEIKIKGEEQKQKMTELLLQPELLDPDAIKQGMQQLVSGQTDLYKGMIKAIRTQSKEDVVALGNSVTGLLDSAIRLGRESDEGSVDKEAQARLEEDNENLQQANGELEEKLDKTEEEMEVLTDEYKSMIKNVKEGNSNSASDDGEPQQTEEESQVSSDDIVDVSGGEEKEEDAIEGDQELMDIAGDMSLEEEGKSEDTKDEELGTPEDMADEVLEEVSIDSSGKDDTKENTGENSTEEEASSVAATADENKEQAA